MSSNCCDPCLWFQLLTIVRISFTPGTHITPLREDNVSNFTIKRLGPRELNQAQSLFALLVEVFGEPRHLLSDSYVEAILGQSSFWAIAALDGEEVVGGSPRIPLS